LCATVFYTKLIKGKTNKSRHLAALLEHDGLVGEKDS